MRRLLIAAAVLAAAALVAAIAIDYGGDDGRPEVAADDPGPIHVHGLGINPKDGALFIATHTGLWRVGTSGTRPQRVTERKQDTMGFTIVGPDEFLGSGHPDLGEAREKGLPPQLGLIESTDAGVTWEPVSLKGEADFHVLRSRGDGIYGFDATNGRLMLSSDGGRTWTERRPPGALLDLAVDPAQPAHLVVTGERGLLESRDEGTRWRALGEEIGLLAWPAARALYLVDRAGGVWVSKDGGANWAHVGEVGGEPAALTAAGERELYVALHDGTIKQSRDGGSIWTVRSTAA